MTKVEFAVPNNSHIIKNCEYDRDMLGRIWMEVGHSSKRPVILFECR
jgi:hypothetical protein